MKALKITNGTMALCAKCALKEALSCGAPHLYLQAVTIGTIDGTAICYVCKKTFAECGKENARQLELYLLPPSQEIHELSNCRTRCNNLQIDVNELRKKLDKKEAPDGMQDDAPTVP